MGFRRCVLESVERLMVDLEFFNRKRVLVTGHTGFKGSWLGKILTNAGALVTGYSLPPSDEPNLFSICGIEKKMISVIGNINNFEKLQETFNRAEPEIVFHLAAQPLVREGYQSPVYTYQTNVMGTVHLLECIRQNPCAKSFLNVTTDKVYHNNEWVWGYRENEPLDGFDPYSNSKSCSELATHCYGNSFFSNSRVAISTARAGNVIGGGDFAKDRILPDCIRAAGKREPIQLRTPHSIRPYQHVLEALSAYLMIAQAQYVDAKYADCYNVGPDECDCISTSALADIFCEKWGHGQSWVTKGSSGPHEANFLKLDCSKLKNTFHWKPRWDISTAVGKTLEWTKVYLKHGDTIGCMDNQIAEFFTN